MERLEKQAKAGLVIRDAKHIRQDLSVLVYDVTVVLVFGTSVPTWVMGDSSSIMCLMLLDPQASFHS